MFLNHRPRTALHAEQHAILVGCHAAQHAALMGCLQSGLAGWQMVVFWPLTACQAVAPQFDCTISSVH
jgi:hypothetical protein